MLIECRRAKAADSKGSSLKLRSAVTCLALAASLLLARGAAGQSPAGTAAPEPNRLDSVARIIAGLPPTHPDHAVLADLEKWKEYSRTMQASWANVRHRQLEPLMAWRAKEIPQGCPVGETLLYPFSGPDFLNAYWLFPGCTRLIFFGLELTGRAPRIDSMTEKEFSQLLDAARGAMINIFSRNYFITSTMAKNLHSAQLRGVVPIIMISMALAGIEVVRIVPIDARPLQRVSPDGSPPVKSMRPRIRGVRIEFRAPGDERPRQLDYYSIDATNVGLSNYPKFLDYLRGLKPTTTLIKSASYLLHNPEFTHMRDALLETSGYLLQDDTGMPYPRLVKRGWQVRVFGRYEVPIPPFEGAFQPSLATAYERANPAPLEFRFGYQRNRAENRSNLMIAVPRAGKAQGRGPMPSGARPKAGAEPPRS